VLEIIVVDGSLVPHRPNTRPCQDAIPPFNKRKDADSIPNKAAVAGEEDTIPIIISMRRLLLNSSRALVD
jgi:hypothetical protein